MHYIKKNMWFLETAMAFLEGDDETDAEKAGDRERADTMALKKTVPVPLNAVGNLFRAHALAEDQIVARDES